MAVEEKDIEELEMDDIKQRVLEDVDPKLREEKKREIRRARMMGFLQFAGIIVLIGIIFYMLMGISKVDGNSMYPTLHDSDTVIYARRGNTYKTGDVIVIDRPGGEDYVKRVIAVAGDTVNIQRGKVYVNGSEVVISQAVGETERASDGEVKYPLVVEEGELFVLGDNREVSEDSREFGTVETEDVKGRLRWYIGQL